MPRERPAPPNGNPPRDNCRSQPAQSAVNTSPVVSYDRGCLLFVEVEILSLIGLGKRLKPRDEQLALED